MYHYKLVSWVVLIIVVLGCEKEVTRSKEIEVKPLNGKVFISSVPSGSEIYINNKIQGKYTPDILDWLPLEQVEITLKRPFYRDTTFSILPRLNSPDSIYIDYLSNPLMYGRIRCETDPAGANIFLNDSDVHRVTPDTLRNLIPDFYNVRFELEGHRSLKFNYLVTSDETIGNYYELEDTTVWVTFDSKNSPIPDDRIFAVENDLDGNIWFTAEHYGLLKYDHKNWRIFTSDDHAILEYPAYSLAVDSSNVLWIGSSQGLISYDYFNFNYYNTENSELPGDQIYDIKVDQLNRVWAATYGGIVMMENGIMTVYSVKNNNSFADYVNCVETLGSDDVWGGHVRYTMSELRDEKFEELIPVWESTQPDIYLGSSVNALAAEPDGNLWIGFYPEFRANGGIGGLALKQDTLWYKDFQNMISREINDIVISGYDEKYVATSGGLIVFTNWADHKNYTRTNSGLYDSKINDICIDNQGVIWLATEHGLTKYKRKY